MEDAARKIQEWLTTSWYKCSADSSSLGLYLCPMKGKLAHEFYGNNGYIWIVGGVYFDDDSHELYGYFGIGLVRNYTYDIPRRATSLLQSAGFDHEGEKYDEWYRYAPFRSIISRRQNFDSQSSAFANWILMHSHAVLKSLVHIQSAW
jgi:hypothetical protein